MEVKKEEDKTFVEFTEDETVVLLEWLFQFNQQNYNFSDQAEQRVLFDLEAILESVSTAVISENYKTALSIAREKIRDTNN